MKIDFVGVIDEPKVKEKEPSPKFKREGKALLEKFLEPPERFKSAEKPYKPKMTEATKKVTDFLSDVMPEEEWRKFSKREKEEAVDFATWLGKNPFGLLGKAVSKPKGEKLSSVLKGISDAMYPLKQLARPIETIRATAGAKIDKKTLQESVKEGVKGFFVPENVEPLSRKIPFKNWEKKGSWLRLIPRALLEGTEDLAMYSAMYGGLFKGKKTPTAKQKKNLIKSYIIRKAKGQGFNPKEISKATSDDALNFILHSSKNPNTGQSFSQYLNDAIKFAYTAPSKLNVGSAVRLGNKSYKIASISGEVAKLIGEGGKTITAKLSDLKPTQPLIEEARGERVVTVTKEQIKQGHKIARDKALISKKNKPKPGYRRLAKSMTGKTSMKKMTQEEAGSFIKALEGLSEATQTKEGKMKPPRIPTTARLTTEGYFQRRFKQPTPAKFATSQTRYAELLGVKDLTEPFEIAKQEMDLEYGNLSRQIDKVIKKVKKTKGLSSEKMALALNTSEEAPIDFTPEQKAQFNYFRDLGRSLIQRENEVLTSLGFEPIKYRQAYFRHIADQMAMDVLRGEHPLPEGLKYWSERVVSKKVFNPTELKRQLEDDLLKFFSKDLEYVSKAMTRKALETIYMSEPKRFFNEQLRALSKDKPIYKDLTPKQKRFYEKTQVLPAETKKWLLDYINIQLGSRQTNLDASVNRFVTESQLKDILNKILKPFGRVISQRPVTKMIQGISRFPIYGAMGGLNPRQIIRNKFQRLQDMALYGVKNTLKGFLPTSREPTLEKLKTNSLFKRSYSGFEEMPAQLRHKAERIGLAPYQWSAQSNVSQTMNAAYHWTKDKIVNPKNKHLGWASPKRTYQEPEGFFYPEEEARLLKEMEYGAHSTQYQYIGMGMPEVFRHKALAGLTRLQSWWMNHWFVFHREATTRAFTGHTGYNPDLKLTAGDRINYLKYLIFGGLILTNLGYYRSYLFGTAPTSLPPSAQLAMGLYQWVANQGDKPWQKRKRAEAEYRIKQALKIHIPGYLTIKDLTALIKGDKDWREYLFYFKEKDKKSEGLGLNVDMDIDMGNIDMDIDF